MQAGRGPGSRQGFLSRHSNVQGIWNTPSSFMAPPCPRHGREPDNSRTRDGGKRRSLSTMPEAQESRAVRRACLRCKPNPISGTEVCRSDHHSRSSPPRHSGGVPWRPRRDAGGKFDVFQRADVRSRTHDGDVGTSRVGVKP